MLNDQELIQLAQAARTNAYAPYSKYPVGAALQCDDGSVFTGCNIENASYGLCMCAERTAIFQAINAGKRNFNRMAVVADAHSPVRPCGACRQVIAEFFPPEAKVIMTNLTGAAEIRTVAELLPFPFDQSYL